MSTCYECGNELDRVAIGVSQCAFCSTSDASEYRPGQVVIVTDTEGLEYPCKLVRRTRIGKGPGRAWFDTLNHIEQESQMRKLNDHEVQP